MSDTISSNNYDGFDELSEMYSNVDMFNTVMETLEDILDDVIGLYEEIEKLIIYRAQLRSGVIIDESIEDIDTEIEEVTYEIEEKKLLLKTAIGNARAIAFTSIPTGEIKNEIGL